MEGNKKTDSENKFSLAVLLKPQKKEDGSVKKGVLVVNWCDDLCDEMPDIKKFFYLIERKGWHGMNDQKTADIKLVDDLSTLHETKKKFPNAIALEFSNADFVDTDVFKPIEGIEKKYTGIQIAAWKEFKRHELFVRGTALLKNERFIKFGHYWDGENLDEYTRKVKTIFLAKRLGADIKFPFWYILRNKSLPSDPVEMNRIINSARMGILTSKEEGISRFKMECLSANIPFLVPEDISYPTKKHINEKTGVMFKPTPKGLADAILYVKNNYGNFSPREYILEHTGGKRALKALQEALRTLAKRDGQTRSFSEIYWNGRNQSLEWIREKAVNLVYDSVAKLE